MTSLKELQSIKDEMVQASAASGKTWRAVNFQNTTALASWLNISPAQGPGEVTIMGNTNGVVNALVYM